MRELTIKQKNLLKKWYNDAEPSDFLKAMGESNKLYSVDDLKNGQFETLENINNTEILWSETNRFLSDLRQ